MLQIIIKASLCRNNIKPNLKIQNYALYRPVFPHRVSNYKAISNCNFLKSFSDIKSGRFNNHKQNFNDFQVALKQFNSNPDSSGASLLISSYAKQKNLEQAFQIYNALINNGKRPTIYVFTALISACIRCEQNQKAVKLYSEMKKYSVSINYVCFKQLLRATSKIGDKNMADILLHRITQKKLDKTPNVIDFTQLIQVFLNCNNMKNAIKDYA